MYWIIRRIHLYHSINSNKTISSPSKLSKINSFINCVSVLSLFIVYARGVSLCKKLLICIWLLKKNKLANSVPLNRLYNHSSQTLKLHQRFIIPQNWWPLHSVKSLALITNYFSFSTNLSDSSIVTHIL